MKTTNHQTTNRQTVNRQGVTRPNARPRRQRFGGAAKTAVSVAAAASLIGGWNLIAHLDKAQADTVSAASPATPVQLPTATSQVQPTPIVLPTLAPLSIAPVPTLKAAPGAVGVVNGTGSTLAAITVPDMPALAPLPTMAPLPSMPSLPPPPPPPSNNGGGGGGGASSGGS